VRTPHKRPSSSRGSHATWSEGDSRTCLHCGKPLRITVDPAIWIHTENGVHTSSHPKCGPPWETPIAHASDGSRKVPANTTNCQEPR
jgi:hypothetical protein